MKNYGKISKGLLVTIIVIACVLIFAIVGVLGYLAFDKAKKQEQEKILSDEITSMYTSQKISTQIKTTGKFANVEYALKEYYTEYINASKDLKDIYSKNLLDSCLTATSISSDGPEFTKTRENIKKIRDVQTATISKYNEFISDEYINNKAKELNLNEYYTNLYISEINNTLKVKEDFEKINNLIKQYNNWIDKIEDVVNFLTENKASWKVNQNSLIFTSTTLVTKYNTLITALKTQESLLKIKFNSLKI